MCLILQEVFDLIGVFLCSYTVSTATAHFSFFSPLKVTVVLRIRHKEKLGPLGLYWDFGLHRWRVEGVGWGECDSWQRQCDYEVTVEAMSLNCGFSVDNMFVLKVTTLSKLCKWKVWVISDCHHSPLHVLLSSFRTHIHFVHEFMGTTKPCVHSPVRLPVDTLGVHVTLKTLFFCHSVCPGTVGKTFNCSTEVGCSCYASSWVWYFLWVLRHFLSNKYTCLSQHLLQCGGLRSFQFLKE